MPFNIDAFRAALRYDGARQNLFEVTMPFPALAQVGVSTDGQSVSDTMRFMCRAAQLPGSTVGSIPVNYFGRESKHAGNRVFTEWTLTLINDEDFKIKNAFELWMNGLNSHQGNLRDVAFASPASYTVDATIVQYGKTGDVLKSYTMNGAFPIDISPIDVDWAANDTIEEYAITLSYQYWISDPNNNKTGGANPKFNVPIL